MWPSKEFLCLLRGLKIVLKIVNIVKPALLVKEMVIVLLRHFKQTQDFTSFPRQAIIAHQSNLNSYFRALQYRSLLGADY